MNTDKSEIKVGQWYVREDLCGRAAVARVESVVGLRVFMHGIGGAGKGWHWVSDVSHDRLATPREALDAKLATLTLETRTRVLVTRDFGDCRVYVDGSCMHDRAPAWWWRAKMFSNVDADIDAMLSALDAALAKPTPHSALWGEET